MRSPTRKRDGSKAVLTAPDAWVQYDRADFGAGKLRHVMVRTLSSSGGRVEIRMDRRDGPLIAEVNIANRGRLERGSGSPF